MIAVIRHIRAFVGTIWRGIDELDDWYRGDGPKPGWLRKKAPTKQFNSLDEIVQDYLASLPDDEARRKFIADATRDVRKRPPT
jgi:hypothetical protein